MIIPAVAAATGLALGAVAPAGAMSKTEYGLVMKKIEFRYKVAKIQCDRLLANAKDICMAEAKGKANVGMAELAARKHPGRDARYDVTIARAEAVYAVAREKCDDLAGNAKDVCVKEAKAAHTAAKADAMTQRKTSAANRMAKDKTAKAKGEAHGKILDARHDAAAEKNNAEYKVAIEKCDALSGTAKDGCVHDANKHYGKS